MNKILNSVKEELNGIKQEFKAVENIGMVSVLFLLICLPSIVFSRGVLKTHYDASADIMAGLALTVLLFAGIPDQVGLSSIALFLFLPLAPGIVAKMFGLSKGQ